MSKNVFNSNQTVDSRSTQEVQTNIMLGDCLEKLAHFPDNTFDLIVTSPPYADSRSKTYGGIKPNEYVEWQKC
jgi:DNA modification methylase